MCCKQGAAATAKFGADGPAVVSNGGGGNLRDVCVQGPATADATAPPRLRPWSWTRNAPRSSRTLASGGCPGRRWTGGPAAPEATPAASAANNNVRSSSRKRPAAAHVASAKNGNILASPAPLESTSPTRSPRPSNGPTAASMHAASDSDIVDRASAAAARCRSALEADFSMWASDNAAAFAVSSRSTTFCCFHWLRSLRRWLTHCSFN
mmetsp:Transcript_90373/g.255101  ORF Transcript_90373/g.255101 Transcript_90373/m.255101 type:complete len:209 (-) Transcript_90373:1689-2315(-)